MVKPLLSCLLKCLQIPTFSDGTEMSGFPQRLQDHRTPVLAFNTEHYLQMEVPWSLHLPQLSDTTQRSFMSSVTMNGSSLRRWGGCFQASFWAWLWTQGETGLLLPHNRHSKFMSESVSTRQRRLQHQRHCLMSPAVCQIAWIHLSQCFSTIWRKTCSPWATMEM